MGMWTFSVLLGGHGLSVTNRSQAEAGADQDCTRHWWCLQQAETHGDKRLAIKQEKLLCLNSSPTGRQTANERWSACHPHHHARRDVEQNTWRSPRHDKVCCQSTSNCSIHIPSIDVGKLSSAKEGLCTMCMWACRMVVYLYRLWMHVFFCMRVWIYFSVRGFVSAGLRVFRVVCHSGKDNHKTGWWWKSVQVFMSMCWCVGLCFGLDGLSKVPVPHEVCGEWNVELCTLVQPVS